VLGALDGFHPFCFALRALKLQDNFLCRFCLFLENGLRLTAKASLFFVVASLPLSTQRSLSCFVLRDLVRCVFLAFSTEGVTILWDVHHGTYLLSELAKQFWSNCALLIHYLINV